MEDWEMTALSATIGQGSSQASRWVSKQEQKQQKRSSYG